MNNPLSDSPTVAAPVGSVLTKLQSLFPLGSELQEFKLSFGIDHSGRFCIPSLNPSSYPPTSLPPYPHPLVDLALSDGSLSRDQSPGFPLSTPSLCHEPDCRYSLVFNLPDPFTTCSRCGLSAFASPRVIPDVLLFPPLDQRIPFVSDIPDNPCFISNVLGFEPLAPESFMWDNIRLDPDYPLCALVCVGRYILARLPSALLSFWHDSLLSYWESHIPGLQHTENDVAAFITAFIHTSDPALWVPPPPDQRLITWMAPIMLPQAGIFRRVRPPVPWRGGYSPDLSPFEPVAELHAVLSSLAYRILLEGHPFRAFLTNGIHAGFTTFVNLPPSGRKAPSYPVAPELVEPFQRYVDKELFNHFFMVKPDDIPEVQLRPAPLFPVPKINPDGSHDVRAVSDLSFDWPTSVNGNTRRSSFLKLRLAKLQRILLRIVFMMHARPGVPIMIAKRDATKAFRQLPMMLNELYTVAHVVNGVIYINTRLVMGQASSGDSMSAAISAIRDILATFAVAVESYVDDEIIISYDDRSTDHAAAADYLWSFTHWPRNEGKFALEGAMSTSASVIGFQVDTAANRVWLPDDKLQSLIATIREWLLPGALRAPRDYARLAGRLQFASQMTPLGIAFTHSFSRYARTHFDWNGRTAPIPSDVLEDLQWWLHVLTTRSLSMRIYDPCPYIPIDVETDASAFGMAGVTGVRQEWFFVPLNPTERSNSFVNHWEGLTIVFAAILWAIHAAGSVLVVHTDSFSSYLAFNLARPRDLRFRLMLRFLSDLQYHFRFRLVLQHQPGVNNVIADHISRHGNVPDSFQLMKYRRRYLRVTTRKFGDLLQLQSSEVANQVPSLVQQLGDILRTTVSNVDTSHLPQPAWTIWNSPRTALRPQVDSSTSSAGSFPPTQPSNPVPCPPTFPPSASSFPPDSVGSRPQRRCTPKRCTVCGNAQRPLVTVLLSPNRSCSACSTISLSRSLSAPPAILRGTHSFASQSTQVPPGTISTLQHFSDPTLSSTPKVYTSISATPNLTHSIKEPGFTFPGVQTDSVPSRLSSITSRPSALVSLNPSRSSSSQTPIPSTASPETMYPMRSNNMRRQVIWPPNMYPRTLCESVAPLSFATMA